MACGAIKRSLEWDPLNSPSQSSTPVVSSARPTKKRCLVHHNYNTTAYSGPKEASPFADLHPKLSPGKCIVCYLYLSFSFFSSLYFHLLLSFLLYFYCLFLFLSSFFFFFSLALYFIIASWLYVFFFSFPCLFSITSLSIYLSFSPSLILSPSFSLSLLKKLHTHHHHHHHHVLTQLEIFIFTHTHTYTLITFKPEINILSYLFFFSVSFFVPSYRNYRS